MSATPRCPHCGSIKLPAHVQQEHDGTTVLVLFCETCGAILAAADYAPHYPHAEAPANRGGSAGRRDP
jgi:hypothetical protein